MPPQTQQPRDVINKGAEAVDAALDVLVNTKDPVQTGKDTIDLGRTLINAKQNVATLDKKMRNLEDGSPGTLNTIEKTSKALDSMGELVMPLAQKVPGVNKQVLSDMKDTSKSFTEFAEAYKAYEKKHHDYIPWNHYGAGKNAVKEWQEFKQDFDTLEKHIPGPIRNQTNGSVVNKAANTALDIGEKMLDLLK